MLEKVDLFKALAKDDMEELEKALKTEKFKKKQVIFHEGDESKYCYILFEGRVNIVKSSADGKELVLEIIDPPDLFGALATLKGIPYPATAIAVENSLVGKIISEIFLAITKKYPDFEKRLLEHITMRLRACIDAMKNIASDDAYTRVFSQLVRLAKKYGKKTEEGILIDIKLTKREIAEMAGVTTETAIRIISKMKKEDVITEKDKKILLRKKIHCKI
ncbi:Crp/Fnr family transcriptional regulator [Thermodesulfovibrio hydrogeniphilus]